MKKLVTFLMILGMGAFLVGCGDTADNDAVDPGTTPSATNGADDADVIEEDNEAGVGDETPADDTTTPDDVTTPEGDGLGTPEEPATPEETPAEPETN